LLSWEGLILIAKPSAACTDRKYVIIVADIRANCNIFFKFTAKFIEISSNIPINCSQMWHFEINAQKTPVFLAFFCFADFSFVFESGKI
jgi:hypothetical protein